MNIGVDAFTLASHVCLILATFAAFGFISVLGDNQLKLGGALMAPRVGLARIGVICMFVLERSYYVVARLLRSFDVNLWAAHPAPEALSAGFAISLFILIWAIITSYDGPRRKLYRAASLTGASLVAVWVSLVALLY